MHPDSFGQSILEKRLELKAERRERNPLCVFYQVVCWKKAAFAVKFNLMASRLITSS